MARQRSQAERHAEALRRIHQLPQAQAVRAAAIAYSETRKRYGTAHQATADAEARLYERMFELHPQACLALGVRR